ncbi:MAG TPA: hypothetical protein VMV18_14905 [bacterium]|nr:hypothetical protein [bacterium]
MMRLRYTVLAVVLALDVMPCGHPHRPMPAEHAPVAGAAGGGAAVATSAAAPAFVPGTILAAEPGEKHLRNLRQLTYNDGENAEAYWSFDGTSLTMQSTRGDAPCDRIWRIDDVFGTPTFSMVSDGKGRTTCSYFTPDDKHILYSSTEAASPECPPKPDMSKGYVWALYAGYDVYLGNRDGSDPKPLIKGPGYDAETTICPKDGSMVFTSTRDGDIDLYRADADGSHVKRLTTEPGYDGGAFFSPDCKQIVWRASRPEGKDLQDYRDLLKEGLIRPTKLEIYVMDADGKHKKQLTHLGAASFGPSFFPNGKRVIFATNNGDPTGRNFDLYAVDVDGKNLERITTYDGFDAFPLFSPDGKHLVFSSNRHGAKPHETNVFVADWID